MTNPLHAALDAYLEIDHPVPHAILVQGPWGSGKTYAVKEYFAPKEVKPIQISLFGLRTIEDIQRRMTEAIIPQAGAAASIVGLIATPLGARAEAESFAKDLVKKLSDKVGRERAFVIDDLERFEGDIGTAMGYLNLLAEEAGRKLILLANEDELRNRTQDWESRAEKLIGRRVTVPTDPGAVLDSLIVKRPEDSPLHKHATRHRDRVLDAFNRTELGNFRSLAWAVENLEKVLRTLGQLGIDLPESYYADLADLVTAFTVEHRGGRIGAEHRHLLAGDRVLLAKFRVKRKPGSPEQQGEQPVYEAADAFLNRHLASQINTPLDLGILYDLESTGLSGADQARAWLNRLGYGLDKSPLDQIHHWRTLTKPELDDAILGVRDLLLSSTPLEPRDIISLSITAIHFEQAGDLRLTAGEPTGDGLRRVMLERGRNGSLIIDEFLEVGHLPTLQSVFVDPDNLSADARTLAASLCESAKIAISDQAHLVARTRVKEMEKSFLAGDSDALNPLAVRDDQLNRHPVLDWLDLQQIAQRATENPSWLHRTLLTLKARILSRHPDRPDETTSLTRLYRLMRDCVAAWEAPLDKLHTTRLDDWARELGLDP